MFKIFIFLTLFFCFNSIKASDFNCHSFLDRLECDKIDYLFNHISNSDEFSNLQKNYIKNKVEELSYYIHNNMNNHRNKNEHERLFRYIQNILKRNEKENEFIINELNSVKELSWDLLNKYSKSVYYKNNFRESRF